MSASAAPRWLVAAATWSGVWPSLSNLEFGSAPRESMTANTPVEPFSAARCTGVSPRAESAKGSAALSNKIIELPSWFFCAVRCSAVSPKASLRFGFAPMRIKIPTSNASFFSAAAWINESPETKRRFGFAPLARAVTSCSTSPSRTASSAFVSCILSLIQKPQPSSPTHPQAPAPALAPATAPGAKYPAPRSASPNTMSFQKLSMSLADSSSS